MLGRLNDMKTKHRLIGDVRGKGLVIGIELVSDQKKKTPAKAEALETVKQAWKLGALLTVVGPDHNVIEMTPPLNISREDVDHRSRLLRSCDLSIGRALFWIFLSRVTCPINLPKFSGTSIAGLFGGSH